MITKFSALLVCLLLVACSAPSERFRYRLKLDVAVGGVIHSGESVAEFRMYEDRNKWSSGLSGGVVGRGYIKGQATVVDLGNGHFLVALLEGTMDGSPGADDRQRSDAAWTRSWSSAPTLLLHRVYGQPQNAPIGSWPPFQGPRAIGANDLPDLVLITRAQDRSSVVRVTPDDLSRALGENASIVNAQIEVTTDPISRGISEQFPWLRGSDPGNESHYAGVIDPPKIGDFRRGVR